MATERSLERLGVDQLDLLLLHNPDRTGYTSRSSGTRWPRSATDGLAQAIGVAPGPANGFTLDLIDCFERFGDEIDWGMVILNPFEPWPGELVLDAAATHSIRLITRVVDYGGLFWGDVRPGHELAPHDHRSFRPAGWIEAGAAKIEQLEPIRRAHGPDADAARLRLEPRPAGGRVRCADPDPGSRRGLSSDRGEARPSLRRCPPRPAFPPPTSRRSARSATTAARWT